MPDCILSDWTIVSLVKTNLGVPNKVRRAILENGHHRRRLVGVAAGLLGDALRTPEGEEVEAAHVEGRHDRCEDGGHVEGGAEPLRRLERALARARVDHVVHERAVQDLVLAGLPVELTSHLGPRAMRRSFAALYLEGGGSLQDLQSAMGHADPRTTRQYDNPAPLGSFTWLDLSSGTGFASTAQASPVEDG